MAKRIEDLSTGPAQQAKPPQVGGDGGLAELAPNAPIKVGGIEVIVHEYGFFEGLDALSKAPNFMEAFKAMAASGDVTYARIRGLVGRHVSEVEEMIAMSVGQSAAWVHSLGDEDGEVLLATWFAVHCSFFVREALMQLQETMLREAVKTNPSTGLTSLQAFPPPGLETSTPSENSPNVN